MVRGIDGRVYCAAGCGRFMAANEPVPWVEQMLPEEPIRVDESTPLPDKYADALGAINRRVAEEKGAEPKSGALYWCPACWQRLREAYS